MIITTTGYFNTGSSAITHVLKEFDDVGNADDVYEMRLLYDPDCLSDLEYNLIECPHRQNTSHSIIRFKKYIDYNSNPMINHHYEKMCHGNFKKLSYEYIANISDFIYKGSSHIDAYDRGSLFSIINRIYQKGVRVFFSYGRPKWLKDSLLSNDILQYAGTYKLDVFLKATQEYLRQILRYIKDSESNILLIDQFLPPTNIKRYSRYIPPEEKLKVFVVDRDPRDLYVTCKYFLHSNAIPCKNVKEFCDWYKWTRGQGEKEKNDNIVMHINFEDLIYDYEKTRNSLITFCELEGKTCSLKGQIFKPELSINNTQVWKRYDQSQEEVDEIKMVLSDYCYDFDSKKISPDFGSGKMFDC